MTRYAKRVDNNHAEIRDGIRAERPEVKVWDMSDRGGGILDLAIKCRNGKAGFLEIKNGDEPLTKLEAQFISWYPSICGVARTLPEALAFVDYLISQTAEMEY